MAAAPTAVTRGVLQSPGLHVGSGDASGVAARRRCGKAAGTDLAQRPPGPRKPALNGGYFPEGMRAPGALNMPAYFWFSLHLRHSAEREEGVSGRGGGQVPKSWSTTGYLPVGTVGPYPSAVIARFLVNGGNRLVNGAQIPSLPLVASRCRRPENDFTVSRHIVPDGVRRGQGAQEATPEGPGGRP